MPTIAISLKDIEKLLGRKLPGTAEELDEIFQYAKGEVESISGDEVSLNVEDSNRPDLWCAEGVARELKGALGIKKGLASYEIHKLNYRVKVDKKLENIRPYMACAVVKGVKLSDQLIKQIMQQQEKIDGTYGRGRKKTSIGLYNLDLIRFPLRYTTTKPDGIEFIPLDFKVKMTPAEILKEHPKGMEYAHLVKGFREYPIFVDARRQVLSFPPIINSNDLGKLTEKTRNVLIEVTGTDYRAVVNVLIIMTLSLADRDGKIYSVRIDSPFQKDKDFPIFKTQKWKIGVNDINARLGTDLNGEKALELLRKARYDGKVAKITGWEFLELQVPFYRTDIMHDVDIIEDVAIMHGYSNFETQKLDIATIGALAPLTQLSDKVRELMLGFGAQEVQTFTLTSRDVLTSNVNRAKDTKLIEITNPMSLKYAVLRDAIWPTLLEFLSKNTSVEYPQKVFEVGDAVIPNNKAETKSDTVRKAAFLIASNTANFTETKQAALAMLEALGLKASVKETDHPSFIAGRVGKIIMEGKDGPKDIGLIGEIRPEVLASYGIEAPVAGFEISISDIHKS